MNPEEARLALENAHQSEVRLEQRTRWPLWRHAAFGAVEALVLLGYGLPYAAMAVCVALALGGLWLIVADDRRRYGMFVSGLTSRAARPAMWLACAIVMAGFVVLVRYGEPNRWTPLVGFVAAIVLVGCTLASLWWEKLYRAELLQSRGE